MKPLEVRTCQRAENLKGSHRKFQKITTQQQWYRRRADKLSAAAARRSTKVGGGGAHKLSAAARRGRRTALPQNSPDLNPVDYKVWRRVMQDHVYQTRIPDVNDIKQRLFDAWAAAAQMIRPIYYFTNLNFGKKSSSTHILLSVG